MCDIDDRGLLRLKLYQWVSDIYKALGALLFHNTA
jgi:hypothetical protein